MACLCRVCLQQLHQQCNRLFPPFFINYSCDPPCPLQLSHVADLQVPPTNEFASQMDALHKDASVALSLAANAIKRSYDAKHCPAPIFSQDDLVLLDVSDIKSTRPAKKFDFKHHSPFCVLEKVGLQSYHLALSDSWLIHNVFHVSKIHLFLPATFATQLSADTQIPAIVPPNLPHTVAQVLNYCALHSGTQFLVCLEGTAPEDSFWESALSP